MVERIVMIVRKTRSVMKGIDHGIAGVKRMKQNTIRLERQIYLYFDFLLTDYSFVYRKNVYPDYMGFPGPIYVFSYYNRNGCLSFHYIAQKDELGLYIADHYSNHQYDLIEREVSTAKICTHKWFTKRKLLSDISTQLKHEATTKQTVLGIIV